MMVIIDYPKKDVTKNVMRAADILRSNGLNSTGYSNHLRFGVIIGYRYHFKDDVKLPKKSELEEMLKVAGFSSVKVLREGKIK